MSRHAIVVGGGIAGLAAAIYLARGGRKVTVFEKRKQLGGRAITHLRQGFRFNLGPHAMYRAGAAIRILRELGVPVRGGSPRAAGTALVGGKLYRLPASPLSIARTSLLSGRGKAEAASLFFRMPRMNTRAFESITVRQWLDNHVSDSMLRAVMEAVLRVTTYCADTRQSAGNALEQLRLAMRGVIYVHEGWQKLVDGLHSLAVSAGVNFVTSSRVIGLHYDHAMRSIEIGGLEVDPRSGTLSVALPDLVQEPMVGTRVPATMVLLAVDPATASGLVANDSLTREWRSLTPLTVTCLDIALSRLPEPRRTFAVGIDSPVYMSVHSAYAQLTPRGGALIHTAKYRFDGHPTQGPDDYDGDTLRLSATSRAEERELEGVLDLTQPGWRDVLVHRRFLPAITVSNALRTPNSSRPAPETPIRGLYIAGDWVGPEGALADAALASARVAARAMLDE
ncbi:MAG TPA: FAD-dependent oxidoreductase [Thermoanaerobaculia bacterium]|nr:FAD-dependent oxidoreductase [Thermoanaerobaculia bacterium]